MALKLAAHTKNYQRQQWPEKTAVYLYKSRRYNFDIWNYQMTTTKHCQLLFNWCNSVRTAHRLYKQVTRVAENAKSCEAQFWKSSLLSSRATVIYIIIIGQSVCITSAIHRPQSHCEAMIVRSEIHRRATVAMRKARLWLVIIIIHMPHPYWSSWCPVQPHYAFNVITWTLHSAALAWLVATSSGKHWASCT